MSFVDQLMFVFESVISAESDNLKHSVKEKVKETILKKNYLSMKENRI